MTHCDVRNRETGALYGGGCRRLRNLGNSAYSARAVPGRSVWAQRPADSCQPHDDGRRIGVIQGFMARRGFLL